MSSITVLGAGGFPRAGRFSKASVGALAATEAADVAAFTGTVVPLPVVTTGTLAATEDADAARFAGVIWPVDQGVSVFAPQAPLDSRQVVRSFNADGSANFAQVGFQELDFTALFGPSVTSTSQNTIALGNAVFTLDYDDGSIQLDYTVQCLSLDDPQCWEYGVVVEKDTTVSPSEITVAVFRTSALTNTTDNWQIQVVAGPFQGVPASQALAIDLTDTFTVPSVGTLQNITLDAGKVYVNGDTLYAAAALDFTSWFFVVVQSYNKATGAATVLVVRTSATGLSFGLWVFALLDAAGPDTVRIDYSITNNSLASGDITFTTVGSGKFFPIQSPIIAEDLNSAANRLVGVVKAYVGSTLIITVPATGVYGSGSSNAWVLENLGPPQTRISLYQQNGLQMWQQPQGGGSHVVQSGKIHINKGSIRDSTDTVDLPLASDVTIDLASSFETRIVEVAQAGTITSAAGAVTGTGTAFTSNFSASATINDFGNQLTALNNITGMTSAFPSIIGIAGGVSAATTVITDDTDLTANAALSASSSAFNRGGPVQFGINTANPVTYFFIIAYKTADGTTDVFAISGTVSGSPDLPAAYSFFRCIGTVTMTAVGATTTGWNVNFQQPLVPVVQGLITYRAIPKAVYSATITPTAVAGSVSSVNTSTGVITWSTNHGLTNGQTVRGIGTVPTGFTVGQIFYVRVLSGTTFDLHTTLADALAGTNTVALSTTTTGATMVKYVASNEFNIGFAAVSAVAGTPGSTSMAFDLNLTNALGSAVGVVDFQVSPLYAVTDAALTYGWLPVEPSRIVFSSTTLVQVPNNALINVNAHAPGTWANQALSSFTVFIKVWG